MAQVATTRKPSLLPIYLSMFVTALGIGLVTPLVPRLVENVVASETLIGLTASVMFACFVLAAVPLGRGIDRFGVRPFIVLGLIVYAISMALMPFANSFLSFLVLRGLEGVGWAGVWIATETYISWVSDAQQRGRNMAYYSIALALGTSSGPMMGYYLYQIRPWLPFDVTVAMSVAALVLVLWRVREPQHEHHEHQHAHMGKALLLHLLLPLLLAGLYGYGISSLVALLPVSRPDEHEVSLLITITVIANMLAQLPVGYLVDRYGKRPVLLVSLSVLVIAALLASFGPPFPLLLALAVLLGALAGTLYPIGLGLLAERVSSRQLGMANGAFSLSYGLGSVIGPTLTGFAMEQIGSNALFGSLGVLSAIMLVAVILHVDRISPSQPVAAGE